MTVPAFHLEWNAYNLQRAASVHGSKRHTDVHHYFRAEGLGYYRLDGTNWGPDIPNLGPNEDLAVGNVSVFITIEDGEIRLVGEPNLGEPFP